MLTKYTDILHKDFRSFAISPAPHPADTAELFKVFTAEGHDASTSDPVDGRLTNFLNSLEDLPPKGIERFDSHHAMLSFAVDNKQRLQALTQAIRRLTTDAFSQPTSLTLVFNPPAASGTKPSKSPFGLTKAKRDSKAQRQPAEKPLLTAHKAVTSDAYTAPEPISPNFASKPLSGPIPTCFPSLHACERGTNNCTSHGECVLKWSTETNGDGGKQDCFGCACTKPEVRKNKDGTKKTTNFGGAACHKKDVVFPFWLLAGTTVGIIGVITFGLGMLYEMGNQELPSVIGAGVSGPKAGR